MKRGAATCIECMHACMHTSTNLLSALSLGQDASLLVDSRVHATEHCSQRECAALAYVILVFCEGWAGRMVLEACGCSCDPVCVHRERKQRRH